MDRMVVLGSEDGERRPVQLQDYLIDAERAGRTAVGICSPTHLRHC